MFKNVIRGLILGACFFLNAAQAVQDCELGGQSVNPANGSTTRGKTGLMRCKDRDSGLMAREQELRDGAFVGLVRYFQDGKLQREHTVNQNGNRHGRAREFDANGQVLRDEDYVDGSVNGLARSFYANGTLRRATFYEAPRGERAYAEFGATGQLAALQCADRPVLAPAVDDAKLCGFSAASEVEFFRTNGTVQERSRFLAAKRVRHERFHSTGKLALEQETKGELFVERQFDSEGNKRRETEARLLERGRRTEREAEFSANGTLTRERRWGERDLTLDHEFYLNGQTRKKTDYRVQDNQRIADISHFYDTGQPARKGIFVMRSGSGLTPIGTHQSYHDNGQLAAEVFYDPQGRLTRERSFNGQGQPLRDDEVFEDGSRKAFAK